MKLLILTTLLLSAALVNCSHPKVNESEKEFEDEFHKEYKNKEDEQKAAKALAQAEKQMNDENSKYDEGKANYFEKLDADSDLPKAEFELEKEGFEAVPNVISIRGMGDIMVPEEERSTDDDLLELYERQDAPTAWNSVDKNWVTRAKNQGQCGSCAAFSATAVHESCMLKAGAKMEGLDLAEQYLIDCGYNPNDCRNGCNGANTGRYITYYATSMDGSSPHEYDYVYLNKQPKLVCPTDVKPRNFGYKVSESKVDNQCNEDRLKTLISTYGAVSVSIYASDSSFNNYAGGVYDGCTSTSTNHAVTAVGYGTENGVDYWLIKNSWGTGWGLNGFIKMKRGVGMCGIGRNGYAAVCNATTGALSSIPDPPASTECKMNGFSQTGTYGWKFNGKVVWVDCVNGSCKPPADTTGTNACIRICGELNCP